MPIVQIHGVAGRSAGEKAALLSAVRESIVEAFSITDSGLYLLFNEYPKENCLLPEGEEKHLFVAVDCFSGRSPEQKARFYALTEQRLTALGEGEITTVITDGPLHDWGLSGGRSAAAVFGKA